MTDREKIVSEVLARSAMSGKRVFGYPGWSADFERFHSGEMWFNPKKPLPDNWTRICVEGDPEWTKMPPAGHPAA